MQIDFYQIFILNGLLTLIKILDLKKNYLSIIYGLVINLIELKIFELLNYSNFSTLRVELL